MTIITARVEVDFARPIESLFATVQRFVDCSIPVMIYDQTSRQYIDHNRVYDGNNRMVLLYCYKNSASYYAFGCRIRSDDLVLATILLGDRLIKIEPKTLTSLIPSPKERARVS